MYQYSTPAGQTYAHGSLFTPKSYLAAVAESKSMRPTLHSTTTHHTDLC